jgi:glycosyltransferase involved in cell wall biosynthesis
MGWAVALEAVAEPADIWHGMWAGSLPALVRLRRRHGGRAIYDSRDVYMLSREFYTLEWPIRPLLVTLERRWAHRVDRVITVNESYADLIAAQLRVPRPPVVMNTPERWSPPEPPPDLIRDALGLAPGTRIVLYQGQLNTERGIEQAADAVLELPGTALVLLGFGAREERYKAMTREAPYAGHVFHLAAVPPPDLLAWTASADVLVMAIQPTSTNHEFTTPQKLWEALAAGVPVVASDLPGMAEVVRETGAGEVCDPTDPASIAAALHRVLDVGPEQRAALRGRALHAAHSRYNWETQAAVLLDIYGDLLGA